MLFNSFQYLLFFPCVLLGFWLSPPRIRPYLLLVACYGFYMSWKPIYGLLIFALTLVNYVFGLAIAHSREKRKLVLTLAIAANLLTLGFFKYAYLARDLADSMASQVGAHVPPLAVNIILPLGISFFVFEFIHYVVDVYRGSGPIRSFRDFALFASFFPTQIAGPIKRYQNFMPQIASPSRPSLAEVEKNLWLILHGLLKKVLFADYLAIVVHSAFEHPELLSSLDLWLAVYAFAFQIYFDFSAYTDIARGSAHLLGFKVPENFDLPYLSGSISEFWRRWHISLSTWLRDYLFIPLGGSRQSTLLTYRNLMITMILGGIWHGAAIHFAIWGAYQGLLLIINKEFQRIAEKFSMLQSLRQTRLFHLFSVLLTFHAVCLGWVFFRAETIASCWLIIRKLLFLTDINQAIASFCVSIVNTKESTVFLILPMVLTLLFVGQLVAATRRAQGSLITVPKWAQAVGFAFAICLLIVLSPDYAPKFIYFQF
jgi:D-alanyl-lipoteichoic acid acyltransferase DltB (MBOAT superfamily)